MPPSTLNIRDVFLIFEVNCRVRSRESESSSEWFTGDTPN